MSTKRYRNSSSRTKFPGTRGRNNIQRYHDINWSKLNNLLKLKNVPISEYKIFKPRDIKRDNRDKKYRDVIDKFNRQILYKGKLPNDISLSRTLKALRALGKCDDALKLYDKLKTTSSPGDWSITEIIQICLQNDLPQALFFCDEYAEAHINIDNYLAVQIMCVYHKYGNLDKAISIHRSLPTPDRYANNKYIDILLSKNNEQSTQEAHALLNDMEACVDTDMATYSTFIKHLFAKDLEGAVEIYKRGRAAGVYRNVTLKIKRDGGKLLAVLDLHPRIEGRREGAVNLEEAKTAIVCFLREFQESCVHYEAKIITGGTREGQTTLKEEIPFFLGNEYDIEECHLDKNPRLVQFFIPYEAVRKANLKAAIFKLCDAIYTNNQQQLMHEQCQLMRTYQVDMRHHYQQRLHKDIYVLEIPRVFSQAGKNKAREAMEYFDDLNITDALRCFTELVDIEQDHPWASVQCGWMHHRLSRYDKAIDYYKQAVTKNFDDDKDEAHRKWGWALDRQYQLVFNNQKTSLLHEAIEHYQLAIQFNPNNAEVYHNWAMALAKLGDFQQAIEMLMPLVAEGRLHYEACVHIADYYFKLKQYVNAQKYYQDASKRKPENAWVWIEYGNFCLEMYEINHENESLPLEAKTYFENAIRLSEGKDERALLGLIKIYKLLGEKEKAEEYQRRFDWLNEFPQLRSQLFSTDCAAPQFAATIATTETCANSSITTSPTPAMLLTTIGEFSQASNEAQLSTGAEPQQPLNQKKQQSHTNNTGLL